LKKRQDKSEVEENCEVESKVEEDKYGEMIL